MAMLRKQLIEYLPIVLREVLEYRAITGAQQPEVTGAWRALGLVMDNQFLGTATEEGVSVWESELNITPLASDTLESRKQRIQAAWNSDGIFSLPYAREWLKSFDESATAEVTNYSLCATMRVNSAYAVVFPQLLQKIPANIQLRARLRDISKTMFYFGAVLCRSASTTIGCNVPSIRALLTDEQGRCLIDERDQLLTM